ncbi:hypothetical protein DOJK_02470 [Patescibacteria group bacterium]|nr:hypothetical protein DOJK_02470 [Patescibacteria group bacterium]
MKKIVFIIALVLLSSVAFAKSKATPQNHSCVLNDAVVQKTKKECLKAGGKWEKNSDLPKPAETKPSDTTAPTPAPATTDTPAK